MLTRKNQSYCQDSTHRVDFLTLLKNIHKEEKVMLNVKKRDGSILEFKLSKIESAIERAFMAEHKFYNKDIIDKEVC